MLCSYDSSSGRAEETVGSASLKKGRIRGWEKRGRTHPPSLPLATWFADGAVMHDSAGSREGTLSPPRNVFYLLTLIKNWA